MNFFPFTFILSIFIWSCIKHWMVLVIWGCIVFIYGIISCILNIRYKNSFRRKIQIASWDHPYDPTVYARFEVDLTKIDSFIDTFNEQNPENKMSYTVIFAKAIALSISCTNKTCGKIQFGQFTPYSSVDIGILVNVEGENLVPFLLKDCDKDSLRQLLTKMKEGIKELKTHKNKDFKDQITIFSLMPTVLIAAILDLCGYIVYDLGFNFPCFRMKENHFGCGFISNISTFQVHDAFTSLCPFMKSFFGAVMNSPSTRPVVVDGRIEMRKIMNLNFTIDHRFVDGSDTVMIFQKLNEVFDAPEKYV